MKAIIACVVAISAVELWGCSSGPLEPGPRPRDPERGQAEGIGGGSAANKIAAAPSALAAAPGASAAPSESIDFATLRADYTNPNWINPTLPADQWVCALGKVSGDTEDPGWQQAGVFVDSNTNEWVASGWYANNMIVGANCVTLSRFSGPSGSSTWLSGEFSNYNQAYSCDAFYTGTSTWLGDAATFMTEMDGGFYGGGESVSIDQSNDPWSASVIGSTTCQGITGLYARSLFVGIPSSGRQAKFRGPGGFGSAATAGEYVVDRSFVTMARLDEAFCYFTSIRGAFAGAGEKVEISIVLDPNGVQTWAMSTASQQGSLQAKARCYLYDQT